MLDRIVPLSVEVMRVQVHACQVFIFDLNGQVPQHPERSKRNTVATTTTSRTLMPYMCPTSHRISEARTHMRSFVERLGWDSMHCPLEQRLIGQVPQHPERSKGHDPKKWSGSTTL